MPDKSFWDGFNIPFEEDPTKGEMGSAESKGLGNAVVAGAVVIGALVFEHPEIPGPLPALSFRFTLPTGDMLPPIMLVLDDPAMKQLDKVANSAIHAALREASLKRRKK